MICNDLLFPERVRWHGKYQLKNIVRIADVGR